MHMRGVFFLCIQSVDARGRMYMRRVQIRTVLTRLHAVMHAWLGVAHALPVERNQMVTRSHE